MQIVSLSPKLCGKGQQAVCKLRKNSLQIDPFANSCDDLQCLLGLEARSIAECFDNLKLNIVLTGGNGSGKTRLLELMEQRNAALNMMIGDETTAPLPFSERASDIKLINFSCTDAPLQSAQKFSPFTISRAKKHLEGWNVTETALNSLLYMQGLEEGYIDEGNFDDFAEYVNDIFSITDEQYKLHRSQEGAVFFDRPVNGNELSPGQKYLLRMAVALYVNQEQPNLILLLDEPETHLHPNALIEFYEKLREKFPSSQIWVATHSIALIAHIEQNYEATSSIFFFENGGVHRLRSNSEPLIKGLVGGEKNWETYFHFLVRPDIFASNLFAIECLTSPGVVPGKKTKDSQAGLIVSLLKDKIVVDYGAGRGRLLSGIQEWLAEQNENVVDVVREYRAFDIKKSNGEDNSHKAECKQAMQAYGLDPLLYFDDIAKLQEYEKADYVFLVNVLHEIKPIDAQGRDWGKTFEIIKTLLKDEGKLIIVEQQEITVGEKAYDNGFLVLTTTAAKELFGNKISCNFDAKQRNSSFTVPRNELAVDQDAICKCLEVIKMDSLVRIQDIYNNPVQNQAAFKAGLSLAFWEHQYTSAVLNLNNAEGIKHV